MKEHYPTASSHLTPLACLQAVHKSVLENPIIVPNARQIRPCPPANVSSLDPKGHFVVEARFLELVRVKELLVASSHTQFSAVY